MAALILLASVVMPAALWCIYVWMRTRKPEQPNNREGSGSLINRPHVCSPPSSHKFGDMAYKIANTSRYVVGTQWLCDCGNAFVVRDSFWLEWVRDRANDDEFLQSEARS